MTFLSLDFSPKLQTFSSRYPPWMSNRHLQGTRTKEDSCSPSQASPSQLMATLSFELPRLKILKMSLAPLSLPSVIQSVRKQLLALLSETCPESEHFSLSPLLSHPRCPHPSLDTTHPVLDKGDNKECNPKCWWRGGENTTHKSMVECKLIQPLWKSEWYEQSTYVHHMTRNSTPGIHPEEMCIHFYQEIHTRMLKAVLFTMVKTWRQHKCLSVVEWINDGTIIP